MLAITRGREHDICGVRNATTMHEYNKNSSEHYGREGGEERRGRVGGGGGTEGERRERTGRFRGGGRREDFNIQWTLS